MSCRARIAWLAKNAIRTDGQREHEGDEREHAGLRPEHRQAPGDGGEAGADHPGRVLAGDHEHAEHGDRELREVDAGERDVERVAVGLLSRAHRAPVRGRDSREEHGRPIVRNDGGEQRPAGRAQRVELRPLGARNAQLRQPAGLVQVGHGCAGGDAAHQAAASSATASDSGLLNSTSSRVSSMNASSSDACCGVSS